MEMITEIGLELQDDEVELDTAEDGEFPLSVRDWTPEGTTEITRNGVYDVSESRTATVSVPQPDPLPAVDASDNGKVLTVVNGAWDAASLPIWEGTQAQYDAITVYNPNVTYYVLEDVT